MVLMPLAPSLESLCSRIHGSSQGCLPDVRQNVMKLRTSGKIAHQRAMVFRPARRSPIVRSRLAELANTKDAAQLGAKAAAGFRLLECLVLVHWLVKRSVWLPVCF